jgi:hypothetical protein
LLFLNGLTEDGLVKVDLLSLVLALLFVIGLLAIDSVRATKSGSIVDLHFNADQQES